MLSNSGKKHMVFFTSDTNFGHENIIRFCNRPFKSLDHMHTVLKNNWNARVKPKDTIIIVGDFAFRNKKKYYWYSDQLNGEKVFVQGNHDKNNAIKTHITSLVMKLLKKDIFVTHRPSDIVFGYDLYLVGHVHEKWKHKIVNDGERNNILINVGVDVWNFMPVKIDEIMHYIKVHSLSI